VKESPVLHIDIPTLPEFKALAAARSDACVSLYVPTSPVTDDEWSNRIAFKDLAKKRSRNCRSRADKRRMASLKEQFDHLAGRDQDDNDDSKIRKLQRKTSNGLDEFWRYQANGLAVLTTPDTMRTYRLQHQPKPLAEVADRFHLTPLLRDMTSPHRILVLALPSEAVRLVHAFVNLPPAEIRVSDLPKNAGTRPGVRPFTYARREAISRTSKERRSCSTNMCARSMTHCVAYWPDRPRARSCRSGAADLDV
jgi:hypothetical protein